MQPTRPTDASRKNENIFLENQYFSRESGCTESIFATLRQNIFANPPDILPGHSHTYTLLNFSRTFCRKLHRTATFCAVKRANKNVRVVIFFSTTSTHKNHKKLKANNLPINNVRVVHKSITTRTPIITKPLILSILHFISVRVITKNITTRTPNIAKPLISNTLHLTHVRVAFRSV